MKKLCAFLMTILASTIMFTMDVEAKEYTFYEAEMIDGMYMTKEKGLTHLWQKARYFRRSGDNKAAYCLQPFLTFEPGATYTDSLSPENFSAEQKDRISKIAFYGYGNTALKHDTGKWYAVTQLMIWRTAEPTGKFYFTDGPDGAETQKYQNEIGQIEYYISNHNKKVSFDGQTFKIKKGEALSLDDDNATIVASTTDSDLATLDKSKNILNIKPIEKEGEYTINIYKGTNKNENEPVLFYNHNTSQKLVTYGNITPTKSTVKIIVQNPKINLTKIDADTKTTKPSGDAELTGAEYDLLNKDKKVIKHIVIDEDCKVTIDDLDYDTYYLKETKPGTGYLLDEQLHKVTLSKDNPTININLENKVIKRKIELHKKYGDEKHSKPEKDIVFNIYNSKGVLVDSMTTDENGYAVKELPFGTYTIKQETSTDGYDKVDDFEVVINDSDYETIEYDLLDYVKETPKKPTPKPKEKTKIITKYIVEVPNTNINKQDSSFLIIFLLINGLSYVKKEIYL